MLNVVMKALALVALAQGLQAAKPLGPTVAKYHGQHVVQVLGADTPQAVDAVEHAVHEVFLKSFDKGGLTARVSPDQIPLLEEMGLKVKVVIDDLAEHLTAAMAKDEETAQLRSVDSTDPDAYFKRYHPYMKVFEYLDSLANITLAKGVNEKWLTKKMIGKTVEKRPMWAFEFGNPDAKDAIFMEGGIHAAEWPAMFGTQYVLTKYLEKFASGGEPELFDQFRFFFVPLLNVDGYRYSYLTDRLWRKNRRVGVNDTCCGVDLNRNFNGFDGWRLGDDECARNYGGPEAYSEPEAKVMSKYVEELKDKYRFVAMLDMHTYAQYILYPYGYDFDLPDPPNKKQLLECGQAMSKAMEEVEGKNYTVRNAANWYPAGGCVDDYWYDKIARGPWADNRGLVYTIEMRPMENDPIGFVLPAEELLPTCKEVLAAYDAVVDYVKKELAKE